MTEKKSRPASGGKTTKKTSAKKKPIKKTTTKKATSKKITAKETEKIKRKYYEAVGRRKRAIARVRLFTCQPFEDEEGKIKVNEKDYTKFFSTFELQQIVANPLTKMLRGMKERF